MTAAAGLTSIGARVDALSRMPASVGDLLSRIDERFAALVATATPAVTPAGSSTSPASSSAITTQAITTRAITSPSLTTPGAAAALSPGSAGVSGVWAQRVPNARGQALVPAIAETADRYGLDPAFLAAVFWTESSYTPDAVSPTGAIGLGQLMPETAATLGVDPWDPMQNMDGAARLYRYYLDKYGGNVELSIASYAAGPGAVARAGGVPDEFTANYITKLLGRRDYLNGLRDTAP